MPAAHPSWFAVSDPRTAKYLVDKIGDTEIMEAEETYSMGVANYRDGVSLTQRRKRQRLILDSELMNLSGPPCVCEGAEQPVRHSEQIRDKGISGENNLIRNP